MSPFKTLSRSTIAILTAILLLAAGLRFYEIDQRGLFAYDEGWFLLEAKTLYDTIDYTWQKATGQDPGVPLRDYLKERGTVPVTTFKPGHTVLILVGYLIVGVSDLASLGVSALTGTLTVLLVYGFSSRAFGRTAGLLAALVLAISPFHIGYSRAGYAQANGLFFISLGLYLWYAHIQDGSSRWRLLLAGIATGYGFTCHFNLFLMPPLFLFFHLLCSWSSTLMDRARSTALFGVGMALPPTLFELPAHILRFAGLLPEGQWTYVEQFLYRGSLVGNLRFSLDGAHALLDKLVYSEGVVVCAALLLAAIGIAANYRSISREQVIVSLLFIAPALPWSTLSIGLPPLYRTFAVLSLPVAILAGYGLSQVAVWVPNRRVVAAVAAILLVTGWFQVRDLLPVRSSYRKATDVWLEYMEQNSGKLSFLPNSAFPIWYFYLSSRYDDLSEEMQERVSFYPEEKETFPPAGDYEAFDVRRYYRAHHMKNSPQSKAFLAWAEKVRETRKPILRIENPSAAIPIRFDEVWGPKHRELRNRVGAHSSAGYIEVYDLRISRLTARLTK